MVEFIDAHRGEFGVEPICRALQFAPSTYYDAKSRPESQRARRHRAMGAVLVSIWAANWRVYGARKLWVAARRAGHDIGRDQVARLMRAAGISGATRQRRVHTTKADPCAHRPGDLVRRDFTAAAPNRLWVTDLTVVPTRTGAAYVCLIVDAFSRRIVGWRVAAHMRTSMVLDALEMARRSRGAQLEGLAVHSDASSQGGLNRSSQHLDVEVCDGQAVGVVGDADGETGDEVAGASADSSGCGAGVLARLHRRRARHPGMGALAQPPKTPHLPRQHPASRIRSGLCCPTTQPTTDWKPINRPSRKSRAVQARTRAFVGFLLGAQGRSTAKSPAFHIRRAV